MWEPYTTEAGEGVPDLEQTIFSYSAAVTWNGQPAHKREAQQHKQEGGAGGGLNQANPVLHAPFYTTVPHYVETVLKMGLHPFQEYTNFAV